MNTIATDSKGRYAGPRETFRAGGNVVAAAGTLPFLVITGAAGKVIRVQKIRLSGFTLTAVAYLKVLLQKHSSAWTGGTPVAITETSLDSQYSAAAGAVVSPYTAGPTGGGALVGPLGERHILGQATTPAAAGFPAEIEFDFTSQRGESPALRAAAESLALSFAAAPATAVTLSYEIEWTEDGN